MFLLTTTLLLAGWEVKYFISLWLGTISWLKDELHLTGALDDDISRLVLITVSVTTDDDWLTPTWDEAWNRLRDNRLTKDGTTEDVTNGTVWTKGKRERRTIQGVESKIRMRPSTR